MYFGVAKVHFCKILNLISRGGENRTPTKGFGDPYDTTSPHPYITAYAAVSILFPQNHTPKTYLSLHPHMETFLPLSRGSRSHAHAFRVSFFVSSSRLSPRPISTGQLNTLLCLHLLPINLVLSKGSYLIPQRDIQS